MHLVSIPRALVRLSEEAPEWPAMAHEGRMLTRGALHRPTNWLVCV
jgi:hypothetical protein